MIIGTREQKRRELDNFYAVSINTFHALRHNYRLTPEEQLKALDNIQKAITDMRRLVLYLSNTGGQ